MGSPGPDREVEGLIRNRGCVGAALPSLAPSSRKLFHSATTLLGTQGLSSDTSDSGKLDPPGVGAAQGSPRYVVTCPCCSVPKPISPLLRLKRIQCFTIVRRS